METRNRINRTILAAVLLAAAPAARSADPAPVTLTLQDAERIALERNAGYRAAMERETSAARRSSLPLLPSDPMLMLEKGGQEGSPLHWGSADRETWMLSQEFRFPGKGLADAAAMRASARVSSAAAEEARRRVLMEAREAWWEFYFRTRMAQVHQDTARQWKDLNALLRSRELTGQGRTMANLRAWIDLDRSENDRITAMRELEVSRAALNHLFFETNGAHYVLGDVPRAREIPFTREEAVRLALAASPEVAARRAAADRERALKRAAALDHLPDFQVRAFGSKEPGTSGFDQYGMRVGVTLPVFFPFKQTKAAWAAAGDSRAAEYEARDVGEQVEHMAETAWTAADAARRTLDIYSSRSVEKDIKRAWESSYTAYRNGQATATHLFQDYRMALETLEEYYRARSDYGKALARLGYWTGSDDKASPRSPSTRLGAGHEDAKNGMNVPDETEGGMK